MIILLKKNKNFFSFIKFAEILAKIQQTSKSNVKTSLLSQHLKSLTRQQQAKTIQILNFVNNKVKTNISEKTILKYYQNLYPIKENSLINRNGDVLSQIEQILNINKPVPLPSVKIEDVAKNISQISQAVGKDSVANKMTLINNLVDKLSPIELKFYLRILVKNLRIGVKRAVAQNAFTMIGAQKNEHFINPMLAKPLRDQKEIHDFLMKKNCAILADLKYDGERTIVQYNRSQPIIFTSRRNKSQNQVYPELIKSIQNQLRLKNEINNIILDGQIISVSELTNQPLPFQILIGRRGAKSDQNLGKGIRELFICFDVIQLNGKSLVKQKLLERRKLIPEGQNIKIAKGRVFNYPTNFQELKQFYLEAVNINKYEGLILKGVSDEYNLTGSRMHWGKFKKGCKLTDTQATIYDLDLVVMGGDFGKGKNSSKLASFLLGIPFQGKIYPISKVGSGFTQKTIQSIVQTLTHHIVQQMDPSYSISKYISADKWFKPNVVFQIKCQEFTRSPLYNFGFKEGSGGISLRFPVFQRVREDKSLNQCTEGSEILEMAKNI